MGVEEWSEYLLQVKKGFIGCKEYLQNKHDLLEKASVTLKDSFSVDFILSYCLDVNKFPDGSFQDRQMFTKEVFEIYFGYCKNILLYFDIYSQKSITETTPQVVNYLSKIPNFSDHLALIGYHYQDDCNEWKYTESRLTKERREILQLITVCCCLGHSYLDSPFKFLQLTIFERRRESLQRFIEKKVCEYCNFAFKKEDNSCNVCDEAIEEMDFFKHWELNFNANSKDIYESITKGKQRNKTIELLEDQNESGKSGEISYFKSNSDKSWECSSCTLINKKVNSSCIACFTLKEDINGSGPEYSNSRIKEDETLDTLLMQNMEPKESKRFFSSPSKSKSDWICPSCTLLNKSSNLTCMACLEVWNDARMIRINDVPSNTFTGNILLQKKKKYCSSPALSEESWKCSSCTFINNQSLVTCNACFNTKEDIKVPIKTALDTNLQKNYDPMFLNLIEESLNQVCSGKNTPNYTDYGSFILKSRGLSNIEARPDNDITPKSSNDPIPAHDPSFQIPPKSSTDHKPLKSSEDQYNSQIKIRNVDLKENSKTNDDPNESGCSCTII